MSPRTTCMRKGMTEELGRPAVHVFECGVRVASYTLHTSMGDRNVSEMSRGPAVMFMVVRVGVIWVLVRRDRFRPSTLSFGIPSQE